MPVTKEAILERLNAVPLPDGGTLTSSDMLRALQVDGGQEAHIFGHGGVRAEANRQGLPLLAEIPLSLDVRVAGDTGTPAALGDDAIAESYGKLAARLIGAAERKAAGG